MLEFNKTKILETYTLELCGRIDSLNAPDILRELENNIQNGERNIIMDCNNLSYISSAGLRVFVKANKLLSKAEGKIIFLNMPHNCFEVFKITQLNEIFDFANSLDDLKKILSIDSDASSDSKIIGNIELKIKELNSEAGSFSIIGKENLLENSEFNESDIASTNIKGYRFATGLAAAGSNTNEIMGLFGEGVIINRNLFYYPAIENSEVDFVVDIEGSTSIKYYFLHGFGFTGDFKFLMNFKSLNNYVSLKELAQAVNEFSGSNLTGVVILAESKGFTGMNIKKVPLVKNKPTNNKSIFDEENFFDWFDFPVEPAENNNLIISVGVVVKDKQKLQEKWKIVFPKNDNFHFHSGVFGNSPISHNLGSFDKELNRVNNELDIIKVQHTTGQSEFSYGMIGLIEFNN